jgi:hypothetical protein
LEADVADGEVLWEVEDTTEEEVLIEVEDAPDVEALLEVEDATDDEALFEVDDTIEDEALFVVDTMDEEAEVETAVDDGVALLVEDAMLDVDRRTEEVVDGSAHPIGYLTAKVPSRMDLIQ